tara:strand:- start:641 stop:868 length:228 start_codon:yes stop_codon:yes gene_type:complete
MYSNSAHLMELMTLVAFAITAVVQVVQNVAWLACCDFGVQRSVEKIARNTGPYRVGLSGLMPECVIGVHEYVCEL